MKCATPVSFGSLGYDPFGSVLEGRNWEVGSVDQYRFGFNGYENTDEIYGENNGLDFGARIYNSRLGKFLSTDFLYSTNSAISPYAFVANSPIMMVDVEGYQNMVYIYINETDLKLTQAEKDYLLWAIYVNYAKTLSTNNMAFSLSFAYVDAIIGVEHLDQTDAMLVISDPTMLNEKFLNGGYEMNATDVCRGMTPGRKNGPAAIYPTTFKKCVDQNCLERTEKVWLDIMAYYGWHEMLHYLADNFNQQYSGDEQNPITYEFISPGHDVASTDKINPKGLMVEGGDGVRANAIQTSGGVVKWSSGDLFQISAKRRSDLQTNYSSSQPKDNATGRSGVKIIGTVKMDSSRPSSQN